MRVIEIDYVGRTANRVIQYMTARSLVEKSGVKVQIFSKYGIPEFNISPSPLPIINNHKTIKVDTNNIPFDYLIGELVANEDIHVKLNSYCQNINFFKSSRALFSSEIIPAKLNPNYGFGSEFIVFHVRLAYVHHNSSVHPWYVPLPFSYYEKIIKKSGLIPVFVGEFSDDLYSIALKNRFQEALFIECLDSNIVFNLFYNSTNVGISLSTFSWLATFLSQKVQKVYFPIFALFDPLCYRKHTSLTNFLDFEDSRVEYFKLKKYIWKASYSEILSLIQEEYEALPLDENIKSQIEMHQKNLL